jgi:hypothetical protein
LRARTVPHGPARALERAPPGVRRTQVQRQADDEGKRAFAEGQGKVKAEKVLTRNPRQAQLKPRPWPPWMTTSAMLQCYSIVRQYLRTAATGRINSTRQGRARPCESTAHQLLLPIYTRTVQYLVSTVLRYERDLAYCRIRACVRGGREGERERSWRSGTHVN